MQRHFKDLTKYRTIVDEDSYWHREHLYVLVDDCTPEGLELFGIFSKAEAEEYKNNYSLSPAKRRERVALFTEVEDLTWFG